MSNSLFESESLFFSQRCLCVFVLDISGSMAGGRIEELNKALRLFNKEMLSKQEALEIAIIAFNEAVSIVQQPAMIGCFDMPTLSASGTTATADAVNAAIDMVSERKLWYRHNSLCYYRPWIILVTDGKSDPSQDMESLAKRIKSDTNQSAYNFLPIGFGDEADLNELKLIQGGVPPMRLNRLDFSSFFSWLGASMSISIFDSEYVDYSRSNHVKRIFISYKRIDKDKVFKIKDEIEQIVGEPCWIDLDGIESDAQFMNVIMEAINNADVFLFMYSKAHTEIQDFETDWTVREINFAQKKKKRIVFINIDHSQLSDSFEFMFGTKQQVDALSDEAMKKLYVDMKSWLLNS